jgi:hypothetical protein
MVTAPELPTFGREELVLSMSRLYENEKGRTHSWANGTKLMEMQAIPKPPLAAAAPASPVAATAAPTVEAAAVDKPPAGGNAS